jgi:hypothetical protein
VPYNLFRLFLVHKISIYVYIYINRKRKEEKRKGISSASWVKGDFGPAECARARPGGPLGPPAGNDMGTASWAWAHVPEEGGLTAWSG